jgi:16S rRNA (guanine1207-N2)-methyltransferase
MIQASAYYDYEQLQAEIDGRAVSYLNRAALGRWQDRLASSQLLAEWALVDPHARVLHMHCGDGLVGAAVARRLVGGHLTMLDCHVAAVETARRTLRANDIEDTQVMLSDCGHAVSDRTFDSVIALLPKGRAVWEQTIADAAALLRTGGDFYLSGANNSGIKSAAKFMQRVFGNVIVLAYKRGCRVLRSVKGTSTDPPQSDYHVWRTVSASVGGVPVEVISKPGIFSWDRLDDGTRMLIEYLQAHPLREDDRVLDMGCGSGVLALVAARQASAGAVVALDVDCRAVKATRRTFEHNDIASGEALLSDCGWAVRDRSFSAVVTNPPFHREQATTYAITERIIRDASELLRHRGRLYLVANSFLKYEPIIESAFGNAEVSSQTNRFKVWGAVKHG